MGLTMVLNKWIKIALLLYSNFLTIMSHDFLAIDYVIFDLNRLQVIKKIIIVINFS